MSSTTNKHMSFPEKGNPYEALSLENFASSTTIKKKFRELSLKLHPDKRQTNLSQKEKDELDHKFILVQEARSFLLDDEFRDQKEKYDAKLKSEILRKEEDRRREEQMGSQRRKMKHDLEKKINELRTASEVSKTVTTDSNFEDLKSAGKRMRESYDQREQEKNDRSLFEQQKRRKSDLENRQVRIKWSRKKLGGQSEHSIAELSSRFGKVLEVELIGSKGNAALVTFQDASSCEACVNAYLFSEELRATYVGERKENAEKEGYEDHSFDFLSASLRRERDRESVEERKLRQLAEREAMLRQFELNGDEKHMKFHDEAKTSTGRSLFPPFFPSCNDKNQSSYERLKEAELDILKGLLSPDQIRQIQSS